MSNDKYEGALDWARNEITQEKFEEVLKREATYKGADADESYARKIAHIKIKAGNSLKHLKAGEQNKAIAELLSLYHVLADEFTKDFNTICEYTESGKQKRVIEQTESIEEVAEVLDVSEETIESLGEGVEVLDEELDHIQRDYHSQTKRESRSFAFDRRLVKTRGNNGKAAGAKQTKAARTALFMPSAEMIDLVQAWEEGVINKNTQLVLVEVDADRATHMEENFQAILAKTTERINEDPERNVQVPTFKNKPRFYKNSVLRLRPNSEVWKDITLDYAFLDYTCSCSESHLRWVENVLYQKLSTTSTAAFTHYSTARGKKDVEGSASLWRERKISMLHLVETWVNLLLMIGSGVLSPKDESGKTVTIGRLVMELFPLFVENINELTETVGTPRTALMLNQNGDQNEYSLSYIDWVCIASSFSDAASKAGDNQFALVFEENELAFKQPTIHEYIGTKGATMVTYRFDIQKECKVTEYNRRFAAASLLMGYGVMGIWKMKPSTWDINNDEFIDQVFAALAKMWDMRYDEGKGEILINESQLSPSAIGWLLKFFEETMPEDCNYDCPLWQWYRSDIPDRT
tara:strand:+ start:134 stop:1867 length:1734 start_codon:yes stop_codon:yes gene_type:complete